MVVSLQQSWFRSVGGSGKSRAPSKYSESEHVCMCPRQALGRATSIGVQLSLAKSPDGFNKIATTRAACARVRGRPRVCLAAAWLLPGCLASVVVGGVVGVFCSLLK
eukprot:3372695-Amphidinium_carterae.2